MALQTLWAKGFSGQKKAPFGALLKLLNFLAGLRRLLFGDLTGGHVDGLGGLADARIRREHLDYQIGRAANAIAHNRRALVRDEHQIRLNDQRLPVVEHDIERLNLNTAIAAMMDNMFNVGPYRRCDIHNDNTGWTWFEHQVKNGREPWALPGVMSRPWQRA